MPLPGTWSQQWSQQVTGPHGQLLQEGFPLGGPRTQLDLHSQVQRRDGRLLWDPSAVNPLLEMVHFVNRQCRSWLGLLLILELIIQDPPTYFMRSSKFHLMSSV